MAKNREPEKPVESQSESGEEEEEDASSEEVDSHESDSELELTQVAKKAPSSTPATQKNVQLPPAGKPQQQTGSSSDDEDSGSESGSESDEPDVNIRPITSRPMDDPQKSSKGARKPRSKPNAPEPATPIRYIIAKRQAEEETESKDAKKAKKKADPEASEKKSNDDSKKQLFQRLWSEDDEVAILKGMIEYANKKKSDPVADLSAFHDFIKKNLHVDVTRAQLQDKIRRLRKKYENNKSKEKEGKERTFSKSHEQRAYELSKFVWGNEAGKENGGEKVVGSPKANGSAVRKAPTNRANAAENEEAKGAESVIHEGVKVLPAKTLNSGSASMEERVLAAGAELFEAGKGLDGEKVWKRLKVDEIEIYLKNLEMKVAQTRLVLDVLKSADH